MDKKLTGQFASTSRYELRFAETEVDLRAAQALRYRVFNLELGEGLSESHRYRLDIDEYDMQCDHLIVIDRKTEHVIGTYRMQTYSTAVSGKGFYTTGEFDLNKLPLDILQKSVEVGRACIEKEHRNGRVLYLLWRGIAKYMQITSCQYLLGCCSVNSTEPKQGWTVWHYLKNKNYLHDTFTIPTKSNYFCPPVDDDIKTCDIELPQLFKLYIDLGAKVLSEPALDKQFKTIDFLILLDIENLDERSKSLFFR